MKNFTIVVMAILSVISTASFAQGQSRVTGSITDNNNKALAAVTVSLLKARDSGLLKASVSDAAGRFDISVSKDGNYILSYSRVGFEKNFRLYLK